MRARDVNPTPADLGGVTSVLYELEHRYKYSFLAHTLSVVSQPLWVSRVKILSDHKGRSQLLR